MLHQGDLIGDKYVIERRLASGGMSHVHLAHSVFHYGVKWVVKEVRLAEDVERDLAQISLETELNTLKRLEHPYLARVIDALHVSGALLMVMEYVEGRTLEEIVRQQGAMPEERVREIGLQLCDVLGYLHSRDDTIIYRDLKPANIMLRPDGRICLIDFGTALLYSDAKKRRYIPFGTRGFAAPEQYGMEESLTAATDIYALGKTMAALLRAKRKSLRGRGRISAPMRRIIKKCTRMHPKERYRGIAEVYYALRHPEEAGRPAGWQARAEIARHRDAARINGVLRIDRPMSVRRALSWQDVEIPLDEEATDVLLSLDDNGVRYTRMEHFVTEQDIVVTGSEQYQLVRHM